MKLRIHESLMSYNIRHEQQLTMLDIGKEVWPDANDAARQVNISKLANGHIKRVEPLVILKIAELLRVTLDFMFGRNPEELEEIEKLIEKINELKSPEAQKFKVGFYVTDGGGNNLVHKRSSFDLSKSK